MKNWIKSMFIVLGSMMIATTFVACGSDDDDDNGGDNGSGSTSVEISGTWCMFRANVEGNVSDANFYHFNNGTLTTERYEFYGSRWEQESSHVYKYSITGNKIHIDQFGWMGDADGTFMIKDNILTLFFSQNTYTFKKVNSSVMDYLSNLDQNNVD